MFYILFRSFFFLSFVLKFHLKITDEWRFIIQKKKRKQISEDLSTVQPLTYERGWFDVLNEKRPIFFLSQSSPLGSVGFLIFDCIIFQLSAFKRYLFKRYFSPSPL